MNRDLNKIKAEYFRLLRRWQWIDEEPNVTMDEVKEVLARLATLYQELGQAGVAVPVRLAA